MFDNINFKFNKKFYHTPMQKLKSMILLKK